MSRPAIVRGVFGPPGLWSARALDSASAQHGAPRPWTHSGYEPCQSGRVGDLTPDARTKVVGQVLLIVVMVGALIAGVIDGLWAVVAGGALVLTLQALSYRRKRRRH